MAQEANDYFRHTLMGEPFIDEGTLPGSIEASIEYSKEEGSFYAEVNRHVGIYSASDSVEGIIRNINEQIYEYYGFPKVQYKKFGNKYKPPEEVFEKLKIDGASIRVKMPVRQYAPA